MTTLILVIFILGYLAIALEHPLGIDKTAPALLIGALCWSVLALNTPGAEVHHLQDHMAHHLSDIASILFFLLAAMTIVELIDSYGGFRVITDRINTTNRVKLLWIISVLSFFVSSVLDNLTTTIVMVALLRRMIRSRDDLWLMAGFVVIAANAGGAWSPIGDVTTIMLWIGGQISTVPVMTELIIPSLVCLIVPLLLASLRMRGDVERPVENEMESSQTVTVTDFQRKLILIVGVGALVFVPIFKSITHLPPYAGLLLGLAVLWTMTEIMSRSQDHVTRGHLAVSGILRRIDTPSVLFFLGILLAVAALETAGILGQTAQWLDKSVGNIAIINGLIGLLSAVVDNVPLVAGAMGMYDLATYPVDHLFWHLLAYCAGTGGSILIIGSAAGVAAMGLLHIDFLWYLKRVSLLALAGYLAGLGVLLALKALGI